MPIDIDQDFRTDQNEDLMQIVRRQCVFQHSYNFDFHVTKPNLFHPMMATHRMHCPLAKTKWLFRLKNKENEFNFRKVLKSMPLKIPGNSQSPAGILALISTLPYLNENESCVRILALRIGFIINGMEPVRSQP